MMQIQFFSERYAKSWGGGRIGGGDDGINKTQNTLAKQCVSTLNIYLETIHSMVVLTLLWLSQLHPYACHSCIEFHFSYTLEAECTCAVYRVSPE